MLVGFLTSPFGKESFDTVLKFAGETGFEALEVGSFPGSNHVDPTKVDEKSARDILRRLRESGVNLEIIA